MIVDEHHRRSGAAEERSIHLMQYAVLLDIIYFAATQVKVQAKNDSATVLASAVQMLTMPVSTFSAVVESKSGSANGNSAAGEPVTHGVPQPTPFDFVGLLGGDDWQSEVGETAATSSSV